MRKSMMLAIGILIVWSAPGSIFASESSKPIPGQTFISLHSARNMAAHNRLPKVRANDRFIALKNKNDKVGIPLPMRRPIEQESAVVAAEPNQAMASNAQAKQILSIFAPSD